MGVTVSERERESKCIIVMNYVKYKHMYSKQVMSCKYKSCIKALA